MTKVKALLPYFIISVLLACSKGQVSPPALQDLPTNGIVISPQSTLKFSPTSSSANYTPPGTCATSYYFSATAGSAALAVTANYAPPLNQQFTLTQNDDGASLSATSGTYGQQWLEIQSTDIDNPSGNDELRQGTLTFLSLSGNLAFSFSLSYVDGKTLSGTVNLPILTNNTPCTIETLKPVIYLYPPKPTTVTARLDYRGKLTAVYPDFGAALNTWSVKAYPNGRLTNLADKQEYSYLFWEGAPSESVSEEDGRGFLVPGKETKSFLQNSLAKLGLTPREYNEFIVYWYPKMQNNEYNFIRFAGRAYTESAKLSITPKPDSLLRVFMTYRAVHNPAGIKVRPQELVGFQRKGFTVVEWGGSQLPELRPTRLTSYSF